MQITIDSNLIDSLEEGMKFSFGNECLTKSEKRDPKVQSLIDSVKEMRAAANEQMGKNVGKLKYLIIPKKKELDHEQAGTEDSSSPRCSGEQG